MLVSWTEASCPVLGSYGWFAGLPLHISCLQPTHIGRWARKARLGGVFMDVSSCELHQIDVVAFASALDPGQSPPAGPNRWEDSVRRRSLHADLSGSEKSPKSVLKVAAAPDETSHRPPAPRQGNAAGVRRRKCFSRGDWRSSDRAPPVHTEMKPPTGTE